jgi:hypothetical protein
VSLINIEVERAVSLKGAIADVRLAYAAYLNTGDLWKWLHAKAAVGIANAMIQNERETTWDGQ